MLQCLNVPHVDQPNRRDQEPMKTIFSLFLTIPVLLTGQTAAAAGAGGGARDARLAPYVAVYDLRLLRARRASGIVSANGRIVSTLEGGCEGWGSQTRMVVDYVFRRRGEKLSDSRNTSWEAADGSAFRYTASRRVNGVVESETRLTASRGGTDARAAVKVRFALPRRKVTELPEGTLFPQQATKALIKAALAGKQHFRYMGYEGFENGRARLVTAVIGAPDNRPKPEKLKSLRAWPVALAYYPAMKNGLMSQASFGLPEYEMSFRLFENGVIDRVTLRFTNFTLTGRLARLELKKPPACP